MIFDTFSLLVFYLTRHYPLQIYLLSSVAPSLGRLAEADIHTEAPIAVAIMPLHVARPIQAEWVSHPLFFCGGNLQPVREGAPMHPREAKPHSATELVLHSQYTIEARCEEQCWASFAQC